MKVPPGVPYEEVLYKYLKKPEESIAYLNACLEDKDPRVFLTAVKHVIEAHGGVTKFSRKSKLARVSIYKMLSKKGNPGFMNILTLLECAGVTLEAVTKKPDRRQKAKD